MEDTPVEEQIQNQVIMPLQEYGPLQQHEVCTICNELLRNNTPLIETLCNHSFHTNCFMFETEDDFHCPRCHVCLFGPNHIRVHREKRDQIKKDERTTEIQEKFLLNRALSNDFKLIKKEIRKLSGFYSKYKKFYRNTDRTYKTETEFFVKMIKQKKKEFSSQLRQSAEFKEYVKQKRRTNRLLNQFEEEYEITFRELTRVPDLKLKRFWYYNRLLYFGYNSAYLRRIRI